MEVPWACLHRAGAAAGCAAAEQGLAFMLAAPPPIPTACQPQQPCRAGAPAALLAQGGHAQPLRQSLGLQRRGQVLLVGKQQQRAALQRILLRRAGAARAC